jgi:hypothetical protein
MLLGVVVAVAVGAALYVLHARSVAADRRAGAAGASGPATRDDLAAVAAGPHVVFRSTAPGGDYGRIALAPLSTPDGPRAVTGESCERVYAAPGTAICLAASEGFTPTYSARILGPDWTARHTLPLPGVPSRARISRDGTLIATTSFIRGDSYTSAGQFSTRTVVTHADGRELTNIEDFTVTVDGHPLTAADKNLWGVTFVNTDLIYATVASGGRTWLAHGSLSARTLTAVQADAECPSVSPDGTRVVYKKRGALPPGHWRLTAYDVATGRETPLAEVRSVDDQVDWLDSGHVVYGLPREGTAAASADVWTVPADGSGSPAVLIHNAWSPSVVG